MVEISSNFAVDWKARSTRSPVSRFLKVSLTVAPPLPIFWWKYFTTWQGLPSNKKVEPFFRFVTSTITGHILAYLLIMNNIR